MLDHTDDRNRDPVKERGARNQVLLEKRGERIREIFQQMGFLETADQGEKSDIEKDGPPVQLLEYLFKLRFLQTVPHTLDDQDQEHRTGQRDETKVEAQILAQ